MPFTIRLAIHFVVLVMKHPPAVLINRQLLCLSIPVLPATHLTREAARVELLLQTRL